MEEKLWRSVEEWDGPEAFRKMMENEFPEGASEASGLDRREFLRLMGASMALAGAQACRQKPMEKILPYVKDPEHIIPGKPLFFATTTALGGYGVGVLATSHMGRPTKIEGNELHPASLGATDVSAQASILGLYDPDRSQGVQYLNRLNTWDSFVTAFKGYLEVQDVHQGAGLRILSESFTSPSLIALKEKLLRKYPKAHWHHYEPDSRDLLLQGTRLAFGDTVEPVYNFDKADVVVSFDADFLSEGPGKVRYARDFARRRKVFRKEVKLNRLYVLESTPTITGGIADHRWAVKASEIPMLVCALARELGILAGKYNLPAGISEVEFNALVADLKAKRGAGLVLVDAHQEPWVQALAHHINDALNNRGATVRYIASPLDTSVDQMQSLKDLTQAMAAGNVDLLVMVGGNPVFNAPVDLKFEQAMLKVGHRVHLALYEDETSALCHWHIPEAHYLEAWGDARAFDGTLSVQQPLIEPLYDGKSALELISLMTSDSAKDDDLIRNAVSGPWRKSVHDGVVAGSAFPEKMVRLQKPVVPASLPAFGGLELQFRADPFIGDGRGANNGWLQELPRPMTKLTWDNALMVSPTTAARMGVASGDEVEITAGDDHLKVPMWILPGQPNDALTLHLGFGRERTGRVGEKAGFNAYAIRKSSAPWCMANVEVKPTGGHHKLATTQTHHSMEGRNLVRHDTAAAYTQNPEFAHSENPTMSLYPPQEKWDGPAWGMVIDLNSCTGCNACMIACQSENNIPVVGKKEVLRGRSMHWIRADRYFEGDINDPDIHFQPVTCMHCENAPCEPVCPAAATVHGKEGLNEMIYNRCVGTRYCSNNCPYKVRRFNFLEYSDLKTESLKPMRNPNVTVRERGVMEKCTYCVQRINSARIDAKKENREIRDGEVTTACQSACAAQAIVFGNLNDADSRISKLRSLPLNYGLLTELNTRPRTTYLAKVKNPNPELKRS